MQNYQQPNDQAELKPLREFLGQMESMLDGVAPDCQMASFRAYGCNDRFFIEHPDGAEAGQPTTLISEAFDPPQFDFTASADSVGSPAFWEWLREDGKWMKFSEGVQKQLNEALQPGVGSASVEFELGVNEYRVDFTVNPHGETTGYTEQSAEHPSGTPWWAVEATQTNQATSTKRPVRLCDSSCLLSVDQWYDRTRSSGATPELMMDLKPLKSFKMKPGADDDGVLRWMHGENGFESCLKDALAEFDESPYVDKDADWEPMISNVLMEASEIIGSQDWPNELGFGAFDKFSQEVLSSGIQTDDTGICVSSMEVFVKEHTKRTKHLEKCAKEVKEKLGVVEEKKKMLNDLEELNLTIDEFEFAEGQEDEQLELLPKLKALLQTFGYVDNLDDTGGVRMAYEDFQDGSAVTAERIDDELLTAQIDLMKVLAKLAASAKGRVDTMKAMLPEVEGKAQQVQTDSAKLCEKLQSRFDAAKTTVELTKAEAEQTRNKMKQHEDMRTAKRIQYKSELNNLHVENDTLMNEIRTRMVKLHENEVQIRTKTMLDKGDEASFQKKIAECEQNLATLAGCQDEMEKLVTMLDTTKTATQTVARCADLMLVKHPQSIVNNIKKDIEQTQDIGREHDTIHFEAYCAAWSKTLEDSTYVQAELADIEAKIDQCKSAFISARRGK